MSALTDGYRNRMLKKLGLTDVANMTADQLENAILDIAGIGLHRSKARRRSIARASSKCKWPSKPTRCRNKFSSKRPRKRACPATAPCKVPIVRRLRGHGTRAGHAHAILRERQRPSGIFAAVLT